MTKLSYQAIGAIMMALQKGIMDQTDITNDLREFTFALNNDDDLEVINPPTVDATEHTDDDES
jgi:hypothetical protein